MTAPSKIVELILQELLDRGWRIEPPKEAARN